MRADGFVCLLVSLGALRKGRWVKCESLAAWTSRYWKHRIAHKNEKLTDFPHLKAIPLHTDGFVCLLVSLGELWKGMCVKCEMVAVGKSRSWKKRNANKKWKSHQFPQFTKQFPCTQTGLCIFWCLWEHWEGGGGSNVSWWWRWSQDPGKTESLIKKKTHWFPLFKSNSPVQG